MDPLLQLTAQRFAKFCLLLLPLTPLSYADCTTQPIESLSFWSTSWGIDQRNTRYQPKSALTSSNAAQLKLKWAYGLSNQSPRFLPLVSADTIYIGDTGRGLVALDRNTGCERWTRPHDGPISSAILPATIGDQTVLVYNDREAGVYVVDATTGNLIWHAAIEHEPVPWYSGTPLIANGRVFVPISSLEVGLAVNPLYGCCKTSGGMAAFDLTTGKELWYLRTIREPAEITGEHYGFVQKYGPSGAPVWGAPSYDPARDWIYFGTGQNYSHPTTDSSNAIYAVEAATGDVQWRVQFTPNDAYNAACNVVSLDHPNCPKPLGPDVDFGAATLVARTPDNETLVIAGQKSAEVHALHPATGEIAWSKRLGRGGIIGGVHWGLAVNESMGLVFAPISDKAVAGFPSPGDPAPGLYALDLASGNTRWHFARPSRCETRSCVFGYSAAVTAANDVVVIGSMDGMLEVFDAASGTRLWVHDSWREYQTVNNVPATGGAFDAHGAMLADDLLLITSGYGYVGRQRDGNAFLVFEIDRTKSELKDGP